MSGLLPKLFNPIKQREVALQRAALLANKIKELIAELNKKKGEHYDEMALMDEEAARKTDEIEEIDKQITTRENQLKILLRPHSETVKAWNEKYKQQNIWLTEKERNVNNREKDADRREADIEKEWEQINSARAALVEREDFVEGRENLARYVEIEHEKEAATLTSDRETFDKRHKTRKRHLDEREDTLEGRETIVARAKKAYKDLRERLEKEYAAKDKDIKSRYSALMNAEKELK